MNNNITKEKSFRKIVFLHVLRIIWIGIAAGGSLLALTIWITIDSNLIINLEILIIEIFVGITIAIIIDERSKQSEILTKKTLDDVTSMVKEDYDLKIQRKYQVAQNLQMSLAVKKQATDFMAEQMNLWLNETDKTKRDEIKQQVFAAYSQVNYGYERLNDIRRTSIDILDPRISNDLELLIHCIEKKPEFEDDKDDCYPDPWESASFIIERISSQIQEILHSDPDSFESNYICTIEDKKMEDGTTAKVSVVSVKTKDDEKLESMNWLDKSLQTDSSNLVKLCHKAFELSKEGKHSAAISYCDKVLEIEPNHFLAKINKGYALDNLGMQKEAIKLYDEVLEQEPENVHAIIHKGVAYMMWGKLKKAIPCFEKSIELDPRNMRGHQNLGYCYFYSEQHGLAKDTFEKLLQIEPNHVYALEMKEHAEKELKRKSNN
jgi:tetratricopeptide (TPR) repeat protein